MASQNLSRGTHLLIPCSLILLQVVELVTRVIMASVCSSVIAVMGVRTARMDQMKSTASLPPPEVGSLLSMQVNVITFQLLMPVSWPCMVGIIEGV